jgi:hypothetical protein
MVVERLHNLQIKHFQNNMVNNMINLNNLILKKMI